MEIRCYKSDSLIIQMKTRQNKPIYKHSICTRIPPVWVSEQRASVWEACGWYVADCGRAGGASGTQARGRVRRRGGNYRDHDCNHTFGMPGKCSYGQEKFHWLLRGILLPQGRRTTFRKEQRLDRRRTKMQIWLKSLSSCISGYFVLFGCLKAQ